MSGNVNFFNNSNNMSSQQFGMNSASNPLSMNQNMNLMNSGGVLPMGLTPGSMMSTPNHLLGNPSNNPMMPMSSTPPLNNFKVYPAGFPIKQPTPNLLTGNQINNSLLGFSLATPPPLKINELNFQIPNPYNQGLQQQNLENEKELEKVITYILNLRDHDKREEALQELSKKREGFGSLAPYLWYSVGTLSILYIFEYFFKFFIFLFF